MCENAPNVTYTWDFGVGQCRREASRTITVLAAARLTLSTQVFKCQPFIYKPNPIVAGATYTFNGAGYNLTLPTGEAASLNDFPNRTYGDAGVGVVLTYSDNNDAHWRRGNLVWLNVGGSLGHIGGVLNTKLSNISAFRDSVFLLRERWSAHTSAMFGINDNLYVIPTAFFSVQARAFQVNAGLYTNIRWGGSSRLLAANALQIGVLTRLNQATETNGLRLDAVIPSVRFDFGQFTFGVSYDVNTSVLRQASYGRGGFEFNFA